jgi:outer membrane protein assembly factor BamB
MGGVAALKLEQVANNWKLTPAWLSRDIDMAEEAIIANGVVFTYGAGEDSTQTVQDTSWNEATPGVMGGGLSSGARRRKPGSRQAELVALDGLTGRELWSSGKLESWNHFSGLTVANGRAYITTFDGYMYCFGEHPPAPGDGARCPARASETRRPSRPSRKGTRGEAAHAPN